MGHVSGKGAEQQSLTLWQVAGSVLAAAFGVQSKANKVRDFQYGKPLQFAIVGTLFTAGFVIALLALINAVLP